MTNIQFNSGAIDAGACFSGAWEQIKLRYGLYLGATILAGILCYYLYCISWILFGPVMAGVFLIALRDMREEPVEFGMLFKGFDKFLPLMIVGLIQSIPQIIMQMIGLFANFAQFALLGLGGNQRDFQSRPDMNMLSAFLGIFIVVALIIFVFSLVWYVIFFFAIPIALEHDVPALEAIKLSARAGMANIGGIIVFMIFQFLVALLGVLMLCVGVLLISLPVTMVAAAFAYRQVFPYIGGRITNLDPPPPGEYGFQAGGQYT
jgi:hypothetical protein